MSVMVWVVRGKGVWVVRGKGGWEVHVHIIQMFCGFSSNDLYPLPDSGCVQEQPETEHHGYQPSQICECCSYAQFVYNV